MARTVGRSRTSRADVIQALIDVFRRCGYDGATLSSISEATGLGRASLYHHFPGGKQEMAAVAIGSPVGVPVFEAKSDECLV